MVADLQGKMSFKQPRMKRERINGNHLKSEQYPLQPPQEYSQFGMESQFEAVQCSNPLHLCNCCCCHHYNNSCYHFCYGSSIEDGKHFYKAMAWCVQGVGFCYQPLRGFGVCFSEGGSTKDHELVPRDCTSPNSSKASLQRGVD